MSSKTCPQCGLGQQASRMKYIIDIFDRGHRVTDSELNNCIDIHSHTILGKDLKIVNSATHEIAYCIAGNIGGELNLADWRFASRPPN